MLRASRILVAALLTACSSSEVNRTGKKFPPRSKSWQIEVYRSGGVPAEAFNGVPSFKHGKTPAESIRGSVGAP